jgi:hypothetical protein
MGRRPHWNIWGEWDLRALTGIEYASFQRLRVDPERELVWADVLAMTRVDGGFGIGSRHLVRLDLNAGRADVLSEPDVPRHGYFDVGADGNVYQCDNAAREVHVYSPQRERLAVYPMEAAAKDIAVSRDGGVTLLALVPGGYELHHSLPPHREVTWRYRLMDAMSDARLLPATSGAIVVTVTSMVSVLKFSATGHVEAVNNVVECQSHPMAALSGGKDAPGQLSDVGFGTSFFGASPAGDSADGEHVFIRCSYPARGPLGTPQPRSFFRRTPRQEPLLLRHSVHGSTAVVEPPSHTSHHMPYGADRLLMLRREGFNSPCHLIGTEAPAWEQHPFRPA